MGTESANLSISELTEDFKHTTNEMLLMIQRYEELTKLLLSKLENMTNRAVQAEYQNRLVESILCSGAVLNESEYHKLINGSDNRAVN